MLLEVVPEPVPLSADADDVVRVGDSRVTLDAVIEAFHAGQTSEEIAQQYPSLELAEVYAVIAYYLGHQQQVDDYLAGRRRQSQRARDDSESRFDPNGVRDRLLARRG